MKIPFLDLKASYLEIQDQLDAAASRVLGSGQYIGGDEVEAFEAEFAAYCGAAECVGVANGLEALQLALLAVGVEPGDEVIVPAHTFVATWLAVTHCGAVPVPVDVDLATYAIDATRLEAAITPRVRAVVPVHLYGNPAPINDIVDVCAAHGVAVVEDAAQAHGARLDGRRLGAHGAAAAWSFYPGKNLGAYGDAGAITTNSSQLADRLRLLRNYGSPVRYVHDLPGFNSRLDPLQAALLRVKLAHLDEWNQRRGDIARSYFRGLAGSGVVLPAIAECAEPVWHLFCVRHPMRDGLRRLLHAAGIETLVHYPTPPHLQQAYKVLGHSQGSFPCAEEVAATVFSLPIGPTMSECDVAEVIASVRAAVAHVE
jgi:dTDP-4-amino-4,6-dideoxygalactose transaminase